MAPVTEVKNLVAQLRSGKAPGEDPLPPDAIKNNLDFWAHTLALLFTCINTMNEHKGLGAHDLSPYTVYKKGKKDDPANNKSISFLNTISKLHARWKGA